MNHRLSDTVADSGTENLDIHHTTASSISRVPPANGRTNYWSVASDSDSQSQGYQPESGAKRLLHSISVVFSRDKRAQQNKDEETKQESLAPRLNIETPD